MGLEWPPDSILLGMIGAALGASLPLNAVGTFGTQEAGWAAALATVGVPAKAALAAGFASHSWSVAFAAVHCLVALPFLLAWHRRGAATRLRDRRVGGSRGAARAPGPPARGRAAW